MYSCYIMKSIVIIFLKFLLINPLVISSDIEGGLTIEEWNKKCRTYFEDNPKDTEKEFQQPGYCASYVCQKYDDGQIGMRIDECPRRTVNGKGCWEIHMKSLPFPKCCRQKCTEV